MLREPRQSRHSKQLRKPRDESISRVRTSQPLLYVHPSHEVLHPLIPEVSEVGVAK